MHQLTKIAVGLFLSLLTKSSFAATHPSLGNAAWNLYDVFSWLSIFMWVACIAVGVILLMTAYSQYTIHRFNPKLVPLGTPITYLVLSLAVFAIPFLEPILGVQQDVLGQHMQQVASFDLDNY